MGEFINLKASDGHRFVAWREGPADAETGIVLGHEVFGVNHFIRKLCANYASAGYAVICPALFDRVERGVQLGYLDGDVAAARQLRPKLSDDNALLDIAAAAEALNTKNAGIVGFCWGGKLAWLGATRLNVFKAAVGWYGSGTAAARNETPTCPVQLHFGELDPGTPMGDVELIRKAQPGIEVNVYEYALHAFGCDERAAFNADATRTARQRTMAFLRTHLQ